MHIQKFSFMVVLPIACASVSEDGQWVGSEEVDVPSESQEVAEASETTGASEAFAFFEGSPNGETESQADGVGTIRQPLTGTHKVCSVVNPNNWRVAMVVDDGWGDSTCRSLCTSFSGGRIQKGCLFNTGFSFGSQSSSCSTSGSDPSPNCGW